jgi:hypothetical protein
MLHQAAHPPIVWSPNINFKYLNALGSMTPIRPKSYSHFILFLFKKKVVEVQRVKN